MKKLLIGILIATFISAFIIVYLSNYETSFNDITLNWKDMGRILEKWIAILGIVAIPVVLYFLGQQEQDKKDKLIQEEKQRQDEKDRMERMQNFFTRKIEPLITQIQQLHENITLSKRCSTKKPKDIFILIMTNLEKYRYTMIDIIAHINKITPDMTEREQGIQGGIARRMHGLVEIVSTIILNIFNFEDLYFKDTLEANMIIDSTINGNKILLDLFESLVIYGIGKNNPNDYKQAMDVVYNNHQKIIDNFTDFLKDTNLSQDNYEKNQELQKFIKRHKKF